MVKYGELTHVKYRKQINIANGYGCIHQRSYFVKSRLDIQIHRKAS